jgi:hypothetical protein
MNAHAVHFSLDSESSAPAGSRYISADAELRVGAGRLSLKFIP